MGFSVTIDQFSGPLDLMYHLIKENKLDLFDLNMDVLTDQYLAYLNQMDTLHLEVASEYLSELAGLVEYKSRKLLPKEKVEIAEEYEEDQRERLVRRLLEYQRYKEVSNALNGLFEERQNSFSKPISTETNQWRSQIIEDDFTGNPYDLVKAMNRCIRRIALNRPLETTMTVKEMSVEERRDQIQEKLMRLKGKLSFTQLCNDCINKHMYIITFISILDLIKYGLITYAIDQDQEIWITKGANDE